MSPTKTKPAVDQVTDEDVRAAEQEAREAAELVTALRTRVVDGDDTVTPDQLRAAAELAEFAGLRAEAAKAKAERYRESQRQDRLAEVAEELRSWTDDLPRLEKLLSTAEEALEAFIVACELRGPALDRARLVLHECGVTPGSTAAETARNRGLALTDMGAVTLDDVQVRPLQAGPIIAALVRRVAQRHSGLPVAGSSLAGMVRSRSSDPREVLRGRA